MPQLVRAVKALRAARSVSRSRAFQSVARRLPPTALLMTELLFSLGLTWHWLACIWWFLITNDGSAALGFHDGLWFVPSGDAAAISGTATAFLVAYHWVRQQPPWGK